jgi:hypothetical protein
MQLGRRWLFGGVALAGATGLALAAGGPPATAHPVPVTHVVAKAAAGQFVEVGSSHVITGTPGDLMLNGTGYVAWPTSESPGRLEVVKISANGTVGPTQAALSGWSSLGGHLTLLPNGSEPQVVFVGFGTGQYADSCVYDATGTSAPWTVEPGSLSNDCVNPEPAAARDSSGTVGATWSGAGAVDVRYRLGMSSTIPATGPDSVITRPTSVVNNGMAVRPSDQHFFVSWQQAFGGGTDGFYAEDVSGGGSVLKMPSTGTHSVNAQWALGVMPMAGTANGVFMAACNNSTTCHLLLWKVGSPTSFAVPGAKQPYLADIAPGPGGRLWVAWGDQNDNTVKVTRTNTKDTKFEPVRTYHTGCVEHEFVAISGPTNVSDVALECVSKKLVPAVYVARILPALSEDLNSSKVSSSSAHTLKATVTDAGDTVSGAKVTFHGVTKTVDSKGVATFNVPKGLAPGHYAVVGTHAEYVSAKQTLTVTK